MASCVVPLTVTILRSNVSVRLVDCAVRHVSLGDGSSALAVLDKVGVVLDGAVAISDAATPSTAPLIQVAGIVLTRCTLVLTRCRVTMVGVGVMIATPVEAGIDGLDIAVDNSDVQLTSLSGDGIAVHLQGYRVVGVAVRIAHSTFVVNYQPRSWANVVGLRPYTTASRLGVVEHIYVGASNVTAWIHPYGGLPSNIESMAHAIVMDDEAPSGLRHPDGSNVTVVITDMRFEASASMDVGLFRHTSLNHVFNVVVSVRRVTVVLTIAGKLGTQATGRSANCIEVATEGGGIYNLTLDVQDVVVVSFLPFGMIEADSTVEFQSVESLIAKVYHVSNSTITVQNASIRCQGVPVGRAIASIFPQAAIGVALILENASDTRISVSRSLVWVNQSRYCPLFRTVVDATDDPSSLPVVIRTSGAIYALYAFAMSLSRMTMTRCNVAVTHNVVHLYDFPNRSDCPGPIQTTVEPALFTADIPLLLSVTIGALGLLGGEPLLFRFNGFSSLAIFNSAFGENQRLFKLLMNDANVTVVGNVVSSRRLVSVSEPTLGTLVRAGHVTLIGVNAVSKVSLTVVKQVEAPAHTPSEMASSLYQHPPLAFVDSLAEASGVLLELQHEAAVPAAGGDGVPGYAMWAQQDPAVSINDSTWVDSTIAVGPLGTLHGTRAGLPLVVVNTTAVLGSTQLRLDQMALSAYESVTGGGGNRVAAGSTRPVVAATCVQWEGRVLRREALGTAFPAAAASLAYGAADCPRAATTRTITEQRPANAYRGGRLLPAGATGVAAAGIAAGGLVSTAAVMSMQRSMALLRLSKCDGVDGMHDALDVFTNPVRLTVGDGLHDDDDGPQAENDDDDDQAVAYGAAYRGAIVGNVCVLWGGGVVLALCGTAVLRWKQGPLWRVRESAAVLRQPGNLYPLLGAPLLQPILSCGLALLLHGRGGADWALGVLGVVAGLAVVCGACAVVSRRWFRAASTRAPYVRETRLALQAVCRERGGGVLRRARRAAEAAWLRVALLLFVAEREWVPRGGRDRLFVSSLGGVFEALRDRREWGVAVEMVAVVATSVTAAVLPEGEAACRGVASADAAVNVLLVLFYVLLRPYETRYDHLTAVATAVMTSVLAVMVAAGSDDDDAEAAAEAVNFFSFALLLVGCLQIFSRWQQRTMRVGRAGVAQLLRLRPSRLAQLFPVLGGPKSTGSARRTGGARDVKTAPRSVAENLKLLIDLACDNVR